MREGSKWQLIVVFLWNVYHSIAEAMPHKAKLEVDSASGKASSSTSSGSCNFHRALGAMKVCLETSSKVPDIILNGPGNAPNPQFPKRYLHNMKPVHLWWQYVQHCRRLDQEPASATTFHRCLRTVWEPYLGFRSKCEMTVCTDCEQMKKDMRLARTVEGKQRVASVYSEHIGKQWYDRQVYWRMRDVSMRWWASVKECLKTGKDVIANTMNSWATLITDGVDQARFGLPHDKMGANKNKIGRSTQQAKTTRHWLLGTWPNFGHVCIRRRCPERRIYPIRSNGTCDE